MSTGEEASATVSTRVREESTPPRLRRSGRTKKRRICEAAPAAAPPEEEAPVEDLGSMTVGQIISVMRTRGHAAPSPSSIARREERKRRRMGVTEIASPPQVDETTSISADVDDDAVVAPQVRLDEDGNIVVDQASLVVTAAALGDSQRSGRVTTVENVAQGKHITAGSFAKREKGSKWSVDDTNRFFQAIRIFGTDFSTMQHWFHGRSRRQLKLKFKREERDHPDRVDAAMRRGDSEPLWQAMVRLESEDQSSIAVDVSHTERTIADDGASVADDAEQPPKVDDAPQADVANGDQDATHQPQADDTSQPAMGERRQASTDEDQQREFDVKSSSSSAVEPHSEAESAVQ